MNGSVPDSVPVQLMRRHYEMRFYNREDDMIIVSRWGGYDSESSSPKSYRVIFASVLVFA